MPEERFVTSFRPSGVGLGKLFGELEAKVMDILWVEEEATARVVFEGLRDQGRRLSYSTVKTVLERLVEKGVLSFPIDSHPGLLRCLLSVATRQGIPLPRIAVSPHSAPLALAFGVRQPAIILSQGMLSQFSQAELETVLTHELAHTVRRDNLWN